jgi:signal transduction histidine kinase/CHASE3 domain sensor protein
MSSRRTEILTRVALVAALIIVCVNAWLAFRSVRIVDDSQYRVAHTWQVINATDRIIASMKDAERGNQGYLFTGDPAYLAPYKQATQDVPQEFQQLSALTRDNPGEQAQLSNMRALIEQRLQTLQADIDQRGSRKASAAAPAIQSGTGRAEMDQLQAMANSMQDQERSLLAQRIAGSSGAKSHSQLTILLVSIIDVLLIALVFWMLNRERTLRQKAHATATRLEKLQAISDAGLTQRTLSELIDAVINRLLDVIHADGVVFCNWRDGDIEVAACDRVEISRGLHVQLRRDNPLYAAISRREVIALEGNAVQSVPLDAIRREMSSVLILPVIVAGQVAALLVAGRHSQNAFLDEDESLLTVAADRIGLALDRSKVYEAEREARQLAEKSTAEVQALNAELEERVRLRTAELQASNRELEAFSYSVSHDLRAPLRSVDGFSLALEEDFADAMNEEGRNYIRRIRAGVQKMGQLIDSLLLLSRITRADLLREQVNVSELAGDVARELRAQNLDRNLTFLIEPDLEANADAKLIRVALENLLGNAAKFTSRRPEAVIEFGRSPDTGEFFVRDNGAGFDMQYADKLFQAFQRLHGDKDFKGSGIGLATVSRVIRRHKGTIRTESAIDQGTTFWFTVG